MLFVFLRRLQRRLLREVFWTTFLLGSRTGRPTANPKWSRRASAACVLRLRCDVRRLLERDWERTSRTSSRSSPLAASWSMVRWNSRVVTRAVRAFGLPNNGALTTACGDGSHCFERYVESGEEPNGRQHRVTQGKPLGIDSQNTQDDGGHAETSERPSVQSPLEEHLDEASFQPDLEA